MSISSRASSLGSRSEAPLMPGTEHYAISALSGGLSAQRRLRQAYLNTLAVVFPRRVNRQELFTEITFVERSRDRTLSREDL